MSEAIVLAGGYSSRMERNKMLLDFQGKPLIMHAIDTLKNVVSKIYVVTGFYHEDVYRLLVNDPKVEIVHNERYFQGMFSSVLAGVIKTQSDFFLIPGDYPLVKEKSYRLLENAQGKIRVPVFMNRKGHPIFIDRSLKSELLAETETSNLKAFRDRYPVTYVETDDEGVIRDVDTLNDFYDIQEMVKGGNI